MTTNKIQDTETQTEPSIYSKQVSSSSVSTEPQSPPQKPRRKIHQRVQFLAMIAVLAGIGYGVYRLFFYQPEPDGLFLSGRIESYDTDVSSKNGGRVAEVTVEEGDMVKPGQVLVRIDDSDLQAQLQGAVA